MFHLFKKTYIEVDRYIDPNANRIVISEINGLPMLDYLKSIYAGIEHIHGTSVEEVIGEGKRFASFMEMIQFCFDQNEANDQKIIIYCDPTAYIKIISLWYKTVFVNIDAESAYRISKANFNKEIMITHRSIHGLSDQYGDFLPAFSVFEEVFNASTVDEADAYAFVTGLGFNRSIEYLIAAYFYNGSHAEELKFRVWSMVNRHVEEYFKEAWRTIQVNAGRAGFQEMLGTASYSLDNLLDFVNDPVLEPLKRTNAWRALAGGSNVARTPLDLSTFTEEELNQIKDLAYKTYMRSPATGELHPEFVRKHLYIDIVKTPGLTDEELGQIMDFEINPTDYHKFFSMKDEESINVYFLDWVFDTKKSNNLAPLAAYLLK